MIARLSLPDAAKLLAKDKSGELASLHREAEAIRELMAADRRLHLEGLLTETEFAAGRRKHQADLAGIEQRIADAGQSDVIAPLIGDPARVWAGYGLDKRRAVVGGLLSITITPAPKGARRDGAQANRTSTPARSPTSGGAIPHNVRCTGTAP